MKLKLNGKNGNGKNGGGAGGGGLLKIALLAVAVLLVGLLLYRQIDRLRGPRREVWVAATTLASGSLVSSNDLELVAMRATSLPEDALSDRRQIEGRQVARPVEEGEPFRASDLSPPARPRQQQAASLAELLPEGRVLLRVDAAIESVIMPELRFGDRFELVGRVGTRGSRNPANAQVIASDAFFLAWIDPALLGGGGGGGEREASDDGGLLSDLLSMPPGVGGGGGGSGATSTSSLLLALHPADVLPVAEAQSAGVRLQVVLHGRQEVEEGALIALPGSRAGSVELISGERRERVPVL